MLAKQDFEHFRGRKQEVTLRDDFDAVIHYGRITIELNTNGSAILAFDRHGTVSATPKTAPETESVIHTDQSRNEILDEAALIARSYNHATITFDHLIAAIMRVCPAELAAVMPAGIMRGKLQKIVEAELRDEYRHPNLLTLDSTLKIDNVTCLAVENGTARTRRLWRTDQLLGVEILHAMLKSVFQEQIGRNASLDYIGLVISDHLQRDAIAVNRKSIDKYAADLGETISCLDGPAHKFKPR